MSENRSMKDLLIDLGVMGDPGTIAEYFALGLSVFDESDLLNSQPSLAQLSHIGMTLESDRLLVMSFIDGGEQEKDPDDEEKGKETVYLLQLHLAERDPTSGRLLSPRLMEKNSKESKQDLESSIVNIFDGGELEEVFFHYSVATRCVENFLFYKRVHIFQSIKDRTARQVIAREIWELFFKPDSPNELNLSGKVVAETKAEVEKAPFDCFAPALKEIVHLMAHDSVINFLHSKPYAEYTERKDRITKVYEEIKLNNHTEVHSLLVRIRDEWAKSAQKEGASKEQAVHLDRSGSSGEQQGHLSLSRAKENYCDPAVNWNACFDFLNKEFAKEKDYPKVPPALYLASYTNSAESMVAILNVASDFVNVNFQLDPHKGTPLHVASYFGFGRCCAVLLYFGASQDLININGKLPKEEAKGEALTVFDLFAKKGRSGLLSYYPSLFSHCRPGLLSEMRKKETAEGGSETPKRTAAPLVRKKAHSATASTSPTSNTREVRREVGFSDDNKIAPMHINLNQFTFLDIGGPEAVTLDSGDCLLNAGLRGSQGSGPPTSLTGSANANPPRFRRESGASSSGGSSPKERAVAKSNSREGMADQRSHSRSPRRRERGLSNPARPNSATVTSDGVQYNLPNLGYGLDASSGTDEKAKRDRSDSPGHRITHSINRTSSRERESKLEKEKEKEKEKELKGTTKLEKRSHSGPLSHSHPLFQSKEVKEKEEKKTLYDKKRSG